MEATVAEQQAKMLTIGEAARRLGVSESGLRKWADAGRVRHAKTLGGRRLFDPAEIERVRQEMGY
jgi:excisionase family DNA binding protein